MPTARISNSTDIFARTTNPFHNSRRFYFSLSRPVRLTLVYLLFGGIWILFTDWVLLTLTSQHPELLPLFMKAKGLLFIGLSSLLLYILYRAETSALEKTKKENRTLAKRYDALRNASKEAIYEYDLKENTIHINPYLKQMFGLKEDVMENGWELWQQKVHPSDHERIRLGMETQLLSGESTWQDEYQLMDADGKYRSVLHTCFVILNDHGKPYRVMGTLLDITELRSLQKKYHQQEMLNKSALMRGIINAEENERNRWAVELHDNIGQLLAVTKLYLANFSENRAPDKDMLERTKDIVQLSLTEIRQLSARLKTPVFEDQTLEKAIVNLAENIKRAKEISFSIKITVDESLLKEEHKLMLYRVIQEQTSNIIKYAEANNVLISISNKGQTIKLLVCDDGKGFETCKESAGIGLKNMRSRLQAYKGKMNIISSPGEGCTLNAEFLA